MPKMGYLVSAHLEDLIFPLHMLILVACPYGSFFSQRTMLVVYGQLFFSERKLMLSRWPLDRTAVIF